MPRRGAWPPWSICGRARRPVGCSGRRSSSRARERALWLLAFVDGRRPVFTPSLAVLRERDVFGELAALDPEPRSASVTAVEDTLLLALEHAPLLELIGDRPEVARGVIRYLCDRVRRRP